MIKIIETTWGGCYYERAKICIRSGVVIEPSFIVIDLNQIEEIATLLDLEYEVVKEIVILHEEGHHIYNQDSNKAVKRKYKLKEEIEAWRIAALNYEGEIEAFNKVRSWALNSYWEPHRKLEELMEEGSKLLKELEAVGWM